MGISLHRATLGHLEGGHLLGTLRDEGGLWERSFSVCGSCEGNLEGGLR